MTMLVSLQDAKDRLYFDGDASDARLTKIISEASQLVLDNLSNSSHDFLDSSGDVIEDSNGIALGVPESIQSATLMLVGILSKNPDGDPDKLWVDGYLPTPVKNMLMRYRKPALR